MFADLTEVFQWLRRYEQENDILSSSPSRRQVGVPVAVEEEPNHRRLALNLPSLYGRFGYLPDYFTDDLQILGEDGDALRDFLDIFNHRIFKSLFRIWYQNQLFSEDALDGKTPKGREEAFFLHRLAGSLSELKDPIFVKGLHWHKMAAYRKRTRTRDGLAALIHSMFPGLSFEVESFVSVVRPIPEDQRPRLGQTSIQLGMEGNFLTGLTIADPCGGIRLFFKDLDYSAYMGLLPGGATRKQLSQLVAHYTRSAHEVLIRLELRASEVPTWQLGARCLDQDMWLKSLPTPEPVRVEAGRLAL